MSMRTTRSGKPPKTCASMCFSLWGVAPRSCAKPSLGPSAMTEPTRKLARSQMRSWAARHLKLVQGGNCPLCGLEIDLRIKGEGVIDHDHDTGEIRGVLHRSCNAAEGKIANAAARWGAKDSSYVAVIAYLEKVVAYLKQPGTGMIYPMHKTDDEKRDDRNRKAREARAAAKAKLALRRRKEPT